MTIDELTHQVIGMAMGIHRELGPGFLESVYHRAMEIELAAAGFGFESNVPLNVFYKDKLVGKFEADVVVTTGGLKTLIELKSCEAISKAHETQTVNYLSSTSIEDGLIINFGSKSLDWRHKFRTYRPKLQSQIAP
ncbi:GxxExxY protein [Prosthecobacter sp.]|uniref:GxxExxY protein n=1 Tax=Prosthecobacter sp. TaxID=1965333 RepID=UPI002488B668|nr:GxxExxY protein [Prosthecobacter sp.]MDI1314178.1 GxxExxY protein [Prosthecobacter sp.]